MRSGLSRRAVGMLPRTMGLGVFFAKKEFHIVSGQWFGPGLVLV